MWTAGLTCGSSVPAGGLPVWGGPRPVWVAPGTALRLRSVSDGRSGCRLAVTGDCYATAEDLDHGLAAVARGDWRALTCWPGSYWTVVDDGEQTSVLTDVAGTKPVYYVRHGGGTVWASSATLLADLVGADIDYPAITARMVCPTVFEICRNTTAFVGIQRLPGGHVLHVAGHAPPQISRYEPADEQQPFDQAALALRDALVNAVDVRAATTERLSADFSGGLDSTSLALLAVRAGHPVLAVTHGDPAGGNDDLRYATRLAAGHPLIAHVIVSGHSGLFFDDIEDAPITDQPFTDAGRWAMRAGYQRQVIDHGSGLHLTGDGGDTLLAASPFYLADLVGVRPGEVRTLVRHAIARARLRHLPVRSALVSALVLKRTTYRQALRRLAAEVLDPPPRWQRAAATRRVRWCGSSSLAAWLTGDARRGLAAHIRKAAEDVDLEGLMISRHRAWSELREFGAYQAELTAQIRAGGVNAHAPMLDNNVVRAALSIPLHQRQSLQVQKPLLGAALHGLVPELLLGRVTKGAYDGNAYAGIRANACKLRTMIEQSRLAEAGVIDPDLALADLDRLIAGVPGRLAGLETLITTELWLSQHQTRTPTTWRSQEARS